MILFLNFHGVLHPDGLRYPVVGSCYFNRLPRLGRLLRLHPHVRIVISLLWHLRMEPPQLREIFSPDIRDASSIRHPFRFDSTVTSESSICVSEGSCAGSKRTTAWTSRGSRSTTLLFMHLLKRLVPRHPVVEFDEGAERALRRQFKAAMPKRPTSGTNP